MSDHDDRVRDRVWHAVLGIRYWSPEALREENTRRPWKSPEVRLQEARAEAERPLPADAHRRLAEALGAGGAAVPAGAHERLAAALGQPEVARAWRAPAEAPGTSTRDLNERRRALSVAAAGSPAVSDLIEATRRAREGRR